MIYNAMQSKDYRPVGQLKRKTRGGPTLYIDLYQDLCLPNNLTKIFIEADQTYIPYRMLSCTAQQGMAEITLDGINTADDLPGRVFFLPTAQVYAMQGTAPLHDLIDYHLYDQNQNYYGQVVTIIPRGDQPLLETKGPHGLIPIPYHKNIITIHHAQKRIEVILPQDYLTTWQNS